MPHDSVRRFAVTLSAAVLCTAAASAHATCDTLAMCVSWVDGPYDGPAVVSAPADQARGNVVRVQSKQPEASGNPAPSYPVHSKNVAKVRELIRQLRDLNLKEQALYRELIDLRAQDVDFRRSWFIQSAAQQGFDIVALDYLRYTRAIEGRYPPMPLQLPGNTTR